MTDGERVQSGIVRVKVLAGSFRHGQAVPPPSRREALRVAEDVNPYGVPEAAGETVDPYGWEAGLR